MLVVHRQPLGREGDRHVHLRGGRDLIEARGHDADDVVLLAVHPQRPPNDRNITAEAALPEAVAEYDDLTAAWLIFVGRVGAPVQRRHAENSEEVCCRPRAENSLRRFSLRQVETRILEP